MLRMVTPADTAGILEIYTPIVLETPISFETTVPTEAEIIGRIEKTLAHYPWLVIERDGKIAGYAYGSRYRSRPAYNWSAESTVYVSPHFRRQGIARTLYDALLELLRIQGYTTVFAAITMPNPGSVGIHQAVGFEYVGNMPGVGQKFGQWHDTTWWYRPLVDPLPAVAPTIRTPVECADDDAWVTILKNA